MITRSLIIGLFVLTACESKNLGALLEKKTKIDPPPLMPECVTSTAAITCGRGAPANAWSWPASTASSTPVLLDSRSLKLATISTTTATARSTTPATTTATATATRPSPCSERRRSAPPAARCSSTATTTTSIATPIKPELCDDAIDNDCDLVADYLDFAGCTHITASFQDSDGLITLEHGTSAIIRAVLTPPTLELSRKWAVTLAFPDTACAVGDVTLSEPNETASNTERRVRIADDPAKLDCEYRITLTIGGVVADSIRLKMRNTRPRVDEVIGAALDDATLIVQAASGRDPQLTAVVPEDPDVPVVVSWSGRDVGLLDCTAPCDGATMRFRTPPAPGTYAFVLSAKDAFDGIARTRNLRVEVTSCVWARATATGMGTGPALTDAYGSISAAVTAASAQNADVCIAGAARMNISAPLTLPTGVGVTGGFSTGGVPAATKSMLRLTNGAVLSFEAGYTDAIRRVVLDADRALTLIRAVDASPRLFGTVVLYSGSGSKGLSLETTGASPATARFASSHVRSNGPQANATAIEIVGSGAGKASLIWNGASVVDLVECTGVCRGIAVSGNADAVLTAERVDVEAIGAGGRAYAIDVAGATAELRSIAQLIARTSSMDPADVTVAVNLSNTRSVRITTNTLIGATAQDAGRRFSAGIADGEIKRDGSFVRGDSAGLSISGNRQINAGRATWAWNGVTCADEMASREGTDVSAGIVLVGSSTVTIENNGDNSTRDTAIFGGASTSIWDPATRAVPPSVPGIWTVDTIDVRIVKNEIRPGVLSTIEACAPSVRPYVVAVRDGIGAAYASRGLRLEKNGIVSGRRATFDAVPFMDFVGARLVELGGEAFLVNNYLAATRGVELIGIAVQGSAASVELWNNVVEIESLSPSALTEKKHGIVLDAVAPGGVHLINNVIVVREDEEDLTDPVAIYQRGGSASDSIATFNNNLLFVEAEERGATGAYVQIEGGARYSKAAFPDYALELGGTNNLLLPPLFQSHALEHRRSITRISSRSPARDAGQMEGAPSEDRFANMRPIGASVDIGHHELGP